MNRRPLKYACICLNEPIVDTQPALVANDAPPYVALHGGLRSFWRELLDRLVSCWRDPTTTDAQAAAYRGRQYHAALMAMVISGLGNIFTVVALCAFFWDKASQSALIGWVTAVSALAAFNAWLGWSRRHVKVPPPVSRITVILFSIDIALAAFAFSIVPW